MKLVASRPVLFLLGPTASGKSSLAIKLAEELGAHIINGDSVQAYEGANIGSSAPSPTDFQKVPHHLYGWVKAPQELTAAWYRAAVLEKIKELNATFPLAPLIVVGGSGFYIDALIYGLAATGETPVQLKNQIRAELETPEGRQILWSELKARDPLYAGRIHKNDVYRLGRAIEVLRTGQATPSTLFERRKKIEFPYELRLVALERDRHDLVERIKIRTRLMLHAGLVDEVQSLLRNAPPNWAPLRSVGYKQVVMMLQGKLQADQLEDEIVLRTAQLAKRQRTWLNGCNDLTRIAGEVEIRQVLDLWPQAMNKV